MSFLSQILSFNHMKTSTIHAVVYYAIIFLLKKPFSLESRKEADIDDHHSSSINLFHGYFSTDA